MSNPLSVRRVKVQTIDKDGNPEGEPSFGVMASDDYEQVYNDIYESLDELNTAVNEAGNLLSVADDNKSFPDVDRSYIGTDDNFYGKESDYGHANWQESQ